VGQWIFEDEDAPGAKLTQADARARAEEFLNGTYAKYKPLVFDDATTQEQKNRNDYNFTFKVDRLKVDEADFKVNTGVVGKYVSGFSRSWDIPDKWRYERDKVTDKDNILGYVRSIYYVIMSVLGFWWLIFILRTCKIEWHWPIIIGVGSAVIATLRQLNGLPMLFAGYSPDVKVTIYIAEYFSQCVISILSATALVTLASALSLAVFNQALPGESLKNMLHSFIGGDKHGFEGKRRMWLDAVVVGYGIAVVMGALDYVFEALSYLTSPAVHILGLGGAVTASQQWSPCLGALLDATAAAVMVPLGLLATVAFYRKFFASRPWLILAFIVLSAMIGFSYLRYWQDYLWETASFVCLAAAAYFVIARVARNNPLTYAIAGFGTTLASIGWSLSRNAWSVYYADIVVILLAFAAPAVYVAWLYWGPRSMTDRRAALDQINS
jgi:hypothetical protein